MIQQLKRPDEATREAREGAERRGPFAALSSVVLHIVIAIALWQAIKLPEAFQRLFRTKAAPIVSSKPQERLTYVAVPSRSAESNFAPSSPGGRSSPRPREEPIAVTPPLVAPREVPSVLPPPATGPSVPTPSGPTGPLAGGKGPLAGTQPSYQDPRVWVPPGPLATAPKTTEERLDSAVVASVKKFQDSVAANTYSPNKFERGDWTVEKNGRKYGIDKQYIRLGKFSIPTPLLALLPFNRVQANPTAVEEGRKQLAMRMDIMEHAQIAMNEEEFRRAVKAIRERKEREKRNQPEPAGSIRRRIERPVVAPSERPPQ